MITLTLSLEEAQHVSELLEQERKRLTKHLGTAARKRLTKDQACQLEVELATITLTLIKLAQALARAEGGGS